MIHLSSDQVVFWQYGWAKLNLTIVTTWLLLAANTTTSWFATRKLARALDREKQQAVSRISHWRSLVEWVISLIYQQMAEVGLRQPEKYLPFIGTLFVFVAAASLCTILPGFEAPTGSLATTAALAICVFVSVPLFGIREQGLRQ